MEKISSSEGTVPMQAQERKLAPRQAMKRLVVLGTLGVLALFPLLQIAFDGYNYWLHMLLYVFLYIIMATSWNIIGGYAGYISLGHNVFFGVGAYLSGMLFVFFRVSPFLTAPLAGLLAMV